MHNGVNIRDLNGLEAATSQLPLIGFTILWRLEGVRVSHPDLAQALQSAGFEQYLPDPPTPRVALRRALAEGIKTKQRTGRTLHLQLGDEDQEENGAGRGRTGSRRRTLYGRRKSLCSKLSMAICWIPIANTSRINAIVIRSAAQ